ncbi:MAG: fatty acid desaturase family protein [Candidatus Dormibacteraceae bacterium]
MTTTLQGATTPAAPSDYAVLKHRIQEAGLLDRQSGFYLRSIACKLALLVASLALFVLLRHQGWAIVLDAIALAVVFGQLGFQMHDAGHRQMFEDGRANVAVGLLTADLLLGLSYGWWVDKHNRHHAHPNHVDMDPDIGPGMISYSQGQALASKGIRRFVARHQAGLFFPLLFGLGWAMHVKSFTFLCRQRSRYRWLEVTLLTLHVVLLVGFLVVALGPWWALAVIVIQQSCAGFYMACVFAPNHKGMPQVAGKVDFLRRQVLTSRNVRPNPLTDLWYGALNYQIEHHLFPGMSRNRVARAHGIVRRFCDERDIPYVETSIIQSYREILAFLHEVGEPVRDPTGGGAPLVAVPRAAELLGQPVSPRFDRRES